ncbi:MAG: transpeptidase family protein [Deltaproteobacteria bacterium]|nr:transpeptidase family protein [Deltaproteobacteria bacterium]
MRAITSVGVGRTKWVRFRLYFTALVMTALFMAIAYKSWSVQVRDGERMRAIGRSQYLKDLEVTAPRGTIHDRNGRELAVSVEVDSVYANPREITEPVVASKLVGRALGLDSRELLEKLDSDRYFTWIKRRISQEEAAKIRELKLAGIHLVGEPRRFYPGRALAGPVIGLAGVDGKGLEGIELAHDELLRGRNATLPALRDARGQIVLAKGWGEPATPGATVTLTLDSFIQHAAERALFDSVRENKADGGVVVVLDPRNGEVLALASSPSYDPNDPSTRGRKEARNRAVTDLFEAGSVMKAFSIAAAVDAGVVHGRDLIDVEGGRLQIGSKTIRDTHSGENVITVTEVMKYSSNVGAVKIARRLGKERLHAALLRMGFGTKTGIELPGEAKGKVHDPKRWGEIGIATISFGYGLMVSPLQLAASLAAIANGGTWNPPRIVKRIVGAGGHDIPLAPRESQRVFKAKTAREVTEMLKAVLEKGGTAEKVVVPGFVAAGKTGTAHKKKAGAKGYDDDSYLSSFIGFVPADEPRLVIVVLIDGPRAGKYYGGAVAGPVFARIAGESLKYMGIAGNMESPALSEAMDRLDRPSMTPLPEPAVELGDTDELPPAGPGEPIVLIPDFRGMSLSEAIAAATTAGVRVELQGSGRAVSQFPPPGRAMKSITCRIAFDPG